MQVPEEPPELSNVSQSADGSGGGAGEGGAGGRFWESITVSVCVANTFTNERVFVSPELPPLRGPRRNNKPGLILEN